MSANSHRPTAKIYQFPTKAVANAAVVREIRASNDQRLRAAPAADFGGAWYHDAAILADRARNS